MDDITRFTTATTIYVTGSWACAPRRWEPPATLAVCVFYLASPAPEGGLGELKGASAAGVRSSNHGQVQ